MPPPPFLLFFFSTLPPPLSIGGYEEVCQDVADGLLSRGHHVSVLTSSFRSGAASDPDHVHRHLAHRFDFGQGYGRSAPRRNRMAVDWHNVHCLRRLIKEV